MQIQLSALKTIAACFFVKPFFSYMCVSIVCVGSLVFFTAYGDHQI